MPLATLKKVLAQAEDRSAAALGFVCQGWEDSRAYVRAGEAADAPVILSAGPGARANMPVHLWGEMFRELAKTASVPVVAHLDHGRTLEDCETAIEAGFSSVMIDGSALPLAENIALTNAVSTAARRYGISVEAEVGQVGYEDGAPSEGTTVEEARIFAAETTVDALAISVGLQHSCLAVWVGFRSKFKMKLNSFIANSSLNALVLGCIDTGCFLKRAGTYAGLKPSDPLRGILF